MVGESTQISRDRSLALRIRILLSVDQMCPMLSFSNPTTALNSQTIMLHRGYMVYYCYGYITVYIHKLGHIYTTAIHTYFRAPINDSLPRLMQWARADEKSSQRVPGIYWGICCWSRRMTNGESFELINHPQRAYRLVLLFAYSHP